MWCLGTSASFVMLTLMSHNFSQYALYEPYTIRTSPLGDPFEHTPSSCMALQRLGPASIRIDLPSEPLGASIQGHTARSSTLRDETILRIGSKRVARCERELGTDGARGHM